MRGTRSAVGTVLVAAIAAIAAAPAPAARNAKPKILSAKVVLGPDRGVNLVVVGRDRDDVVRGAEVTWGAPGDAFGISACEMSSRGVNERKRGKKARFELMHTYAEPGHYTVTVRVISGGCGKRAQQRSAPRKLVVHVD